MAQPRRIAPKSELSGQGFLFDQVLETSHPSVGVYERTVKLLRAFTLISDARQRMGFGKIFESREPEDFRDLEKHYGKDLYLQVLPGARFNDKKWMARARKSYQEAGGYIALRKTMGWRKANNLFREDWDRFLTTFYIVPDVTKFDNAPNKLEEIEALTEIERRKVQKRRNDYRKLLKNNQTKIEEGRISRAA